MATEADYRLPRSVVPRAYRVEIEPDLEAASFVGTVAIDVDIAEPTSTVTLNSIELQIGAASITVGTTTSQAEVSLDPDRQRLTLTLEEELPVGPAIVEIGFDGVLNDRLRGFYRSTYTDAEGDEQTIATTQFEATDARRAFPCWDEPDLKATFSVVLVVDEHLTALSNAAEVLREPAGDGKIRVTFAESMVMSTYLVAFIVGDLEVTDPVDVGGIPLRIAAPPGKLHLTDFALEAGAHALNYFADYYDVPYPGDKLDMVAIPDFAWGAMENLGCITYRETALLVDEGSATTVEVMRVAEVIAHEVAHMWFGDLVTMKWWNGIWLNEAFATFAENKCVDDFRPEWEHWLHFATDRRRSQETDGLKATRPIEFAVASPAEADAMFDVLTYEKGSSVLRMLERFLGEEAFRAGVSRYLRTHAFSNTENTDLWAALEAESGEPVGEIMDTWIFQGGYPEISVEPSANGVTLTQSPFRFIGEGEGSWQVPVLYRSSLGEGRVVVGDEPVEIEVGDDVIVNAGGEGFYRVAYHDDLIGQVADAMPELGPLERFSVVSDVIANMMSGEQPASEFIEFASRLQGEDEIDVWQVALAGLGELDRIASSDDRDALRSVVQELVRPKADELGWNVEADESDRTRSMRGLLLKSLGGLAKDTDTIAQARQIEASDAPVDAEVADAALMITAGSGDLGDFERFIDLSESAATPQLKVKYLRAAVQVPHPDVPVRIVNMVVEGEIKSQDSFWVIALLLGQKENGAKAWDLITKSWEEVMAALPPSNARRILDHIQYRSEPDVAASIVEWFSTHEIPGGEAATRQHLEMLEVRVGLRNREAQRLGEALR